MIYEPKPPKPLSGAELVAGRVPVLEFWRWAYSDLRDNTSRGVFAEYLVGLALGCISGVRESWDDFDLLMASGVKVEVKSAAYLQAWPTAKLSEISFGGLRGRAWTSGVGYAADRTYRADVYVFGVLTCIDHSILDPLLVDQWDFYVASRARVEATDVRRLSLSSVKRIAGESVRWADLLAAVVDAAA